MKKFFMGILVLGLIAAVWGLAVAAPMSDLVRAQLAEKAKQTLGNQEWTVYVTSTGKKAVTETDVFTFSEGKVVSANLSAQGYKKSNLNVGVQDDGIIIWETMQVNANNDLAFLKGEISGNNLKGVISMQPVKGAKTVFNFSTSLPQTAPVQATAAQPQKKR